MTILGPDLSHYQGLPNFAQIKASGHDFAILKATEGTSYIDPNFATNRRAAHAAGLIVGMYHFARGGDPAAEAAWFLRTVGTLQPGEFLVLDWEITYAGDHVAWCKAWLDTVGARTGINALIYMNQSAMNGHNWMPVSANHGLWLAIYDGSTAAPGTCNCWSAAAMKQYSDRGTVPGVAGTCDVNAFYGTTTQLLAFGAGAPTPSEDDMTPDQAAALNEIRGYMQNVAPAVASIATMLRGSDPDHDNIWLIWAALYGQSPTGNDNVIVKALADVAAAMQKLQAGGVDPTEVAKLVLAGLNGTTLNVSQPTA